MYLSSINNICDFFYNIIKFNNTSILQPQGNAGTPLAQISHRELIDKLYAFLTAFLQLRYELSVMSMRSL